MCKLFLIYKNVCRMIFFKRIYNDNIYFIPKSHFVEYNYMLKSYIRCYSLRETLYDNISAIVPFFSAFFYIFDFFYNLSVAVSEANTCYYVIIIFNCLDIIFISFTREKIDINFNENVSKYTCTISLGCICAPDRSKRTTDISNVQHDPAIPLINVQIVLQVEL